MKTLVGRAELLDYLVGEQGENIAEIADCFGFSAPIKKSTAEKNVSVSFPGSAQREVVDIPADIPKGIRPPERFYYLYSIERDSRTDNVEGPVPAQIEWLNDKKLRETDEPHFPKIRKKVLPVRELAPWRKIWPVLKQLLSVTGCRNRPDINRLVDALANGNLLHDIPRLPASGWAAEAVVLYDFPHWLQLFAGDFCKLAEGIEKMRGTTGLKIMQITDLEKKKVLEGLTGPGTEDQLKAVPPEVPLLLLGDAGLLADSDDEYEQWCRFGEQLKRVGCFPFLLTPLPENYLTSEICSLFTCIHLSDQSNLKPCRSPRSYGEVQEVIAADKEHLSTALLPWLSVSTFVEYSLLQDLCNILSLDGAMVMLTSLHEEVESTTLGVYVKHDLVLHYRAQMMQLARKKPSLARQVYELFVQCHIHQHPSEFSEEVFTFAETGVIARDATMDAAELYLKRLVVELIEGTDRERVESILHFGTYLLERQTITTKKGTPFLSSLWAMRIKHLGKEGARPLWLQEEDALPLLAEKGKREIWQVIQQGEQLLVCHSEKREKAWPEPIISFSTTSQLLSEEKQGAVYDLPLHVSEARKLPLTTGAWRLLVDDLRFNLSSLTLPKWAESIGRDRQGLFIEYGEEDKLQKTYWQQPVDQGIGNWQGFPPGVIDTDKFGIYTDITINGVTQRFRLIERGSFTMGAPESESDYPIGKETLHKVTFSQGFWMADTTVTQKLWQAVMGNNPARFSDDPENPIETVSWNDIQNFIEKLTVLIPGLQPQLPTEAQWEYCCRAGTSTPFSFGDNITPVQVNYDGDRPYKDGEKGQIRETTVPVKFLPPNQWGLYEMHGNVWEYCRDGFKDDLGSKAVVDPFNDSGEDRVVRGGSWYNYGNDVRSAIRNGYEPDVRDFNHGFRLSLGHAEPGAEHGSGTGAAMVYRGGSKRWTMVAPETKGGTEKTLAARLKSIFSEKR